MKTQTIRIREGTGGKYGAVFLKDGCIKVLRQYIAIRPQLEAENDQPLFYTAMESDGIGEMFIAFSSNTKNRAGISKPGGVHRFARHTPTAIIISKGVDIRIVQKVLRHNDINTM